MNVNAMKSVLFGAALLALAWLGYEQWQSADATRSAVEKTRNDLANHYTLVGVERHFDLALRAPTEEHLEMLYFHLRNQEGLIRAMLLLNEAEIRGKLGSEFFYDERGDMLFGAAPVFLLNILADGRASAEETRAIERLREAWERFREETSADAKLLTLAVGYRSLAKRANDIDRFAQAETGR